jgi:7-cyano-7-deazaguanine reductase
VITIRYVPAAKLAELKSLRDYLSGFRDRQIFQEEVVNEVMDEIVASVAPQFIEVEGVFNMRGGMTTRAVARSGQDPS